MKLPNGNGAHPPIQKIRVGVEQNDSTRVLLTSDYGPGATSPTIGALYGKDASLRPDGKTRVTLLRNAVSWGVEGRSTE